MKPHPDNRSATVGRREFIAGSLSLAAMASAPLGTMAAQGQKESLLNASSNVPSRFIYKTLKAGMIRVEGSLTDKFKAAKEAGFDGVEVDFPELDLEAAKKAVAESGLPIDGCVCSSHWKIRHTSPDAAVRAEALTHLRQAIEKTHAVGGHTVLLVVGHGQDGPESEIWKRSIDNIRQALPLAASKGIYIAIENVWNHFLYDHQGDANQTADKFVKYVDEFDSPWVGMQFDIGNHWKYGDPAAWIRQLGKRVVKLDIKGFSRASNQFKNITGGDIDWASVRSALDDIHFMGWCAAEVDGGGVPQLTKIAQEIDETMGLA